MKKKFKPKKFSWAGVKPAVYADKHDHSGRQWRDTTRHIIKGKEEGGAFDVRYFEIKPGGYTSLERHRHIHSVICVRGRGYAIVGEKVHRLESLDHIYVPPKTPHQFVNEAKGPFGFLCIVDSRRDRPQALPPSEIAALRKKTALRSKIKP